MIEIYSIQIAYGPNGFLSNANNNVKTTNNLNKSNIFLFDGICKNQFKELGGLSSSWIILYMGQGALFKN